MNVAFKCEAYLLCRFGSVVNRCYMFKFIKIWVNVVNAGHMQMWIFDSDVIGACKNMSHTNTRNVRFTRVLSRAGWEHNE